MSIDRSIFFLIKQLKVMSKFEVEIKKEFRSILSRFKCLKTTKKRRRKTKLNIALRFVLLFFSFN